MHLHMSTGLWASIWGGNVTGWRGRSFTSWLKRKSEEQVPKSPCYRQSLRAHGYCDSSLPALWVLIIQPEGECWERQNQQKMFLRAKPGNGHITSYSIGCDSVILNHRKNEKHLLVESGRGEESIVESTSRFYTTCYHGDQISVHSFFSTYWTHLTSPAKHPTQNSTQSRHQTQSPRCLN